MHVKRNHPAFAPLALAAGLACLAGAASWAAGADPRGDHREQLWQLAADVGKRSGTPVLVDPEIPVEAVPEDPGAPREPHARSGRDAEGPGPARPGGPARRVRAGGEPRLGRLLPRRAR